MALLEGRISRPSPLQAGTARVTCRFNYRRVTALTLDPVWNGNLCIADITNIGSEMNCLLSQCSIRTRTSVFYSFLVRPFVSQVRATNLQELVYKNGQAGVSKATVSITFDNRDKKQTPLGYEQYDEITVTRQASSHCGCCDSDCVQLWCSRDNECVAVQDANLRL